MNRLASLVLITLATATPAVAQLIPEHVTSLQNVQAPQPQPRPVIDDDH